METSPVTETVGPDIPTLASSHSLWMAKSKENLDLIEQTKGLMEECNCLKFQLNQIRLKQKVRKRARRTAKEIERKFTCPLCSRAYGHCEPSLAPFVPKSLPVIGVSSEALQAALAEVGQLLGQVLRQNQELQGCLQIVQRHAGNQIHHGSAFRPTCEAVKGYLELVTEAPTQVFKEKGFGLSLRIMSSPGVPCCVAGLHFRIQLYTEEKPPVKVTLNISGKKVLRGSIDAYSDSEGVVSFPNIVINEVSSHYLNNCFTLVVSQSGEQSVRQYQLSALVVKARKQGKVSYKTSIADIDEIALC